MLGKKFDLVVSLGANCSCASYLRKYKLRDYSYPFDWLYSSTFERKIDLIVHDFEGFLLKENMRTFVEKDKRVSTHYEDYEDIHTELRFLHDFPKGMSLDESYGEVAEKYQRRITRLYKRVTEAKEPLFIWASMGVVLSEESILNAQHLLSQKFNKDVNVLVIENDSSLDCVKEVKLNSCAMKVKGPFSAGKGFNHNETTLADTVFARINGKRKYASAVLKALLRLCCCLVPNKNLRRKIRNAD